MKTHPQKGAVSVPVSVSASVSGRRYVELIGFPDTMAVRVSF
jgi:hypothetical protein